MTPSVFRTTVIRPALIRICEWSPAAEDLLLGTAIQESGLRDIDQIGGPALGYFQMEPFTHDDIWKNYLAYRPSLANQVRAVAGTYSPVARTMEDVPGYGAAMARIKYLRSPLPLPQSGDVAGMAHLWKVVYNSADGAGTEQEFIDHWNAACTQTAVSV